MKRLIDTDAAIDHFRRIIDATNTDSGYNEGFIDALEFCISTLSTMPAAERWIPCSERMPEITDYYLIQYSREICPDELAVAFYSIEEKGSDPNYEWEFAPHCGEYKEVIAWMPLPKPYGKEEENDTV